MERYDFCSLPENKLWFQMNVTKLFSFFCCIKLLNWTFLFIWLLPLHTCDCWNPVKTLVKLYSWETKPLYSDIFYGWPHIWISFLHVWKKIVFLVFYVFSNTLQKSHIFEYKMLEVFANFSLYKEYHWDNSFLSSAGNNTTIRWGFRWKSFSSLSRFSNLIVD